MPYTAYELSENNPHLGIEDFWYPNVIAHHVTQQFFRKPEERLDQVDLVENDWQAIIHTELAYDGVHVGIVTWVKDGYIANLNKNGNQFHVTLSLADGHKPVESNDLIRDYYEMMETGKGDDKDIDVRSVFKPLNLGYLGEYA